MYIAFPSEANQRAAAARLLCSLTPFLTPSFVLWSLPAPLNLFQLSSPNCCPEGGFLGKEGLARWGWQAPLCGHGALPHVQRVFCLELVSSRCLSGTEAFKWLLLVPRQREARAGGVVVWRRPSADLPPPPVPLHALRCASDHCMPCRRCLLSASWEGLRGRKPGRKPNSCEIPAPCVISTACLQLSKHNLSGRLPTMPCLRGSRPLFDL